MAKKVTPITRAKTPKTPKKPVGPSKVVRRFAKALADGLANEHWGAIEPETFANIAEGITADDPDGFHADKLDQDEMATAVASLTRLLTKALKRVGVQ